MNHNTTQTLVPVEMTMAESQKTHRDFKGFYNGQRCVLCMTPRGSRLLQVRIVKESK